MRALPLHILEEISDRLRQAMKISHAAEQSAETKEEGHLLALCDEAVSVERVAAMLRVLSAVFVDEDPIGP